MIDEDRKPGLTVFQQKLASVENIRRNWGWFLGFGIILIILGLLAIGSAAIVTDIYVMLLGIFLLIGGILQFIYAFWVRQWNGFFLSLLAGILYAVVGFLFVSHTTASAVSLTLLLAAFYIIGGLFRIIGSAMMRFDQWGWALFSGIVKFVLGLLIMLGWPQTGLWVFGLFIGIDLLFYGWFWVVLSLTVRNIKGRLT